MRYQKDPVYSKDDLTGLKLGNKVYSALPGLFRTGRKLAAKAGFKAAATKGGVMDAIGDVLDFGTSVGKFMTTVIPIGAALFHDHHREC